MNNENKDPEATSANRIAKEASPAGEPGVQRAATEPEVEGTVDLAGEVETLKGQIADLTDRLLRAHAEMDNMRKRGEREREDLSRYAISKFARDVVGVGDNLQRAMAAVPPGAADEDPALKALIDGVAMTERELVNLLERHGVTRLDPKGEIFNPHQHQAMLEMENAGVPSGTVLEVYQPGYMIDERVLRPAMVVVAKGGAKPVRGESSQQNAGEGEQAPAANDDIPVGNGERKAGSEK